MPINRAGQYCLTTIEYAIAGSPIISTHCPSCGLRLIIKYDNFANRVASVSLLLGMSMLIGYNLSIRSCWIRKLAAKFFPTFDSENNDSEDQSGKRKELNKANNNSQPKIYQHANNDNKHIECDTLVRIDNKRYCDSIVQLPVEDFDQTRLSDITCDSAIDMQYGSNEALDIDMIDVPLYELLECNVFGTDCNDKLIDENEENQPNFETGTVDRIDQVLHQIDEIKKSIVEIDDELYHIAGSTYANFNPDFFTLTNASVEEFDRDDEPFDATLSYKTSKDNISCSISSINATLNRTTFHSQNEPIEKSVNTFSEKLSGHRTSHQSNSSLSDSESIQLEWDSDFESNYDCGSPQMVASSSNELVQENQKQSPLKTKNLYSTASGVVNMPMTDEQKLQNMHDLLDQAKKVGLLNNIIDALAPSQTTAVVYRNKNVLMKKRNRENKHKS